MSRRGSPRQITQAAILALLAAAALPAVAQAGVVEPQTVTKDVQLAPGSTANVTLRCPERAVALNGSAPNAISSIPGANARKWTFRFTRSGQALLRCVRLRLPEPVTGVGLAVETKIQPIFEVPPASATRLNMPCSHGMVPTGWGLERTGDANGLSIAQATPTKKGWSFVIENVGAANAAGTLTTRCLERKQRARSGQRHTFSTRIASFTEQIEGSTTTSRSCRTGEYSVATGVSLPTAGTITLAGTGVVGWRGGEWAFSQATGATPVTTSLICLARTTGFHR